MSDPLSQASRELISTLRSHNVIVDTRSEGQARAPYLPAMTLNNGPPGAGVQSLTLRDVAIDIASELKSALKNVQRLIKASPNSDEISRYVETISACLDQSGHEHPRVEQFLVAALESKILERELAIAPTATAPRDPGDTNPPVICSQAALARFLERSSHTARLMGSLVVQGIVAKFEPPANRGGKYKVWLTDPQMHAEALARISSRASKRQASSVNRRKPSSSVE